ncbi:MAG TPA: AAA family ATPase [Gaiellaceae bacterium]|nr:AAA family ATPase [Gaiellaceae bacterium]
MEDVSQPIVPGELDPLGLAVSPTGVAERKLAAVLFVDLVGSTALVAASDPEVARRRVTEFFELASGIIDAHGGTVERFAGDAVMAAFGVPRAHEDDAERALRAAMKIREGVAELGLECRIGVEAGEIVSDETETTFATGQAVNTAARLQQLAETNEILVGPGAHRLTASAAELEPSGLRRLKGFSQPVPVWRAVSVSDLGRQIVVSRVTPLVGREVELALLRSTFEKTVRDRRGHLVTIYGEAGVGKSRLARDFSSTLHDATVLVGRSLPYGEGITYWPLAEMVKASAGIVDDDPTDRAREKLRAICRDEAVADLLALACGLVDESGIDYGGQEIAWAAREWAEGLAACRPLVLGFEDAHWAEEPLLELIEHLADAREARVLILCLARPELLEVYPGWGGGRVRGATIELGALRDEDADELVAALLVDAALPPELRREVLRKTEGNPLYVEETVRLLTEGPGDRVAIPDSVQALIAARIDGLPRPARNVLRRAAVIGRVFWRGAVADLSSDVDDLEGVLETLLLQDFILREPRSSISGEEAYRFKHILTREISYSGLTKSARAELHADFAAWLRERGVEDLVEIRAHHLDRAASLLTELEGTVPSALGLEAASALEAAGARALAREANRAGRHLLLRAVELEPTLERRFQAARAAWRLDDIPAVSVEMECVRADAHVAGNKDIEGRALLALGQVVAFRDSDATRSRELVEEGLALLEPDDVIGRLDGLRQLSTLAKWVGDRKGSRRFAHEAFDLAQTTGRNDLMAWAANALASTYLAEDDLDRAEELADKALRLAEKSGAIVPRGQALHLLGHIAELRGDPEDAVELYESAIALFVEAGAALEYARNLNFLGELVLTMGDAERGERLTREAIGMLKPLGDRGYLCESQRILAEALVWQGRIEEAERYALAAIETVGPQDVMSLATTRVALGVVRAAQGREEEAERLLREALERAVEVAPAFVQAFAIDRLAGFLRARGRDDEAAQLDALQIAG